MSHSPGTGWLWYDHPMKLPTNYRIVLSGTTATRYSGDSGATRAHLVSRLFNGEEVAEEALAIEGITLAPDPLSLTPDTELVAIYQNSETEAGDPWLDAVAAEIERRGLDI